jgi:hypothetical protein
MPSGVLGRKPELDAEFCLLAAFIRKSRMHVIVLCRQKTKHVIIKFRKMKKTIIALAFTMLGLAGSSYAAAPESTVPVPVRIEDQFSQQFAHAMDVRWEEGKNFFKATFEDWGRTLFAFYANNGDLMGVATNLSSSTLPEPLQGQIKKYYTGYWITDLFAYHNEEEKGFVVTLENADRVIVLKAAGDGGWNVYKSTAKN